MRLCHIQARNKYIQKTGAEQMPLRDTPTLIIENLYFNYNLADTSPHCKNELTFLQINEYPYF